MRGTIILSEGRSGTNWVGSLTDSTGVLGHSGEWVDAKNLKVKPQQLSRQQYIDAILENSKTDNNFFMLKMFPRHLHWFEMTYGTDLISDLQEDHEVALIFLKRKDRTRQAISFSRAIQNKSWASFREKKRKEQYDFPQICRCYIGIGKSYAFWQDYLEMKRLSHVNFAYEDLMPNPKPFVEAVAAHAGISNVECPPSKLAIQRDEITETWVKQFNDDLRARNLVKHTNYRPTQKRNFRGLVRFLTGNLIKPVIPYNIK